MPNVTMPDGAVVAMPDNPTPAQLAQLEQVRQQGAMDTLSEVGRVIDKGGRKGLVATPGFAGDVVLSGLRQQSTQPTNQLASQGIFGLPQLLARAFGADQSAIQATHFGDVQHQLETGLGLLPPVSQPQTSLGKSAANVLEPTVATMTGGGAGTLLQKGILGFMSGLGGEGAAKYFDDSPIARFLGSLVGGGATAAVQARMPNADKLVKEATEHMTDADWQKAQSIEQVLNANQIPHTKSQLLGDKSTLDDVVATASSNPSVRPKLVTIPTRATTPAPGETTSPVQQAVNVFTHENLPPPGPGSRAEVLSDVQQAAADKLKSIRDQSNSAFTAAKPPDSVTYPEDRTKALYNALVDLANSPKYGIGQQKDQILAIANELKTGSKVDVSGVNPVIMRRAQAAAQEAGQKVDLANLPGAQVIDSFETNANKVNNLAKGLRQRMVTDPNFNQLPVTDVVNTIKQFTPEFDAARAAKTSVMENVYNPASKSLLGQIAQQGGGPNATKQTARDAAIGIVFNPTQPQGPQIRQLAKDMGGDQVADLLREHINRTMQQVLRTDDKSPRSFVQSLYESPAQKENIDTALEVSAKAQKMNPDAVKVGFKRLMEALDSFKDLKLSGGVSPTTTAQQAGQNIISQVSQPMSGSRRFFEQLTTKGAYNKIADLVTSPDGLQKLRMIAQEPKPELVRQTVIGIIGSMDADSQK